MFIVLLNKTEDSLVMDFFFLVNTKRKSNLKFKLSKTGIALNSMQEITVKFSN